MKLLVFCGLLNIENKQALVDMFVSHNAINLNDAVASNNLQQLNDYLLHLQQGKTQTEYQDKVAIYFYNGDVELLNSTPLNSDNYHYISFYSAPEVSIAPSLSEQDWVSHSSAILDLHLSNMEHSYLINQADIVNHVEQIVKLLNSVSGLVLKTLTVKQQAENLLSIAQIVQSINSIKNNPQLQQLFEQLEGAADITKTDYGLPAEARLAIGLSMLLTTAKETQHDVTQLASHNDDLQQQNSVLKEQATAGDAEKKLALLQINQLQEELELAHTQSQKLAIEHHAVTEQNKQIQQQLALDTASFIDRLAQSEIVQAKLTSENELALLQIGQLQEELEQSFVNSEQLKADHQVSIELLQAQAERQQELLTNENELALQQISQLQEELEQSFINSEQLKADNQVNLELLAQAERQQESLIRENELALLQISQLQEELEQSFVNSEQFKADNQVNLELLAQAERQQESLIRENELALQQIGQLQEKLEQSFVNSEQLKADNQANLELLAQAERQQESLIRENELALQQIGQLQEKLEQSFVNSEQLKADNQGNLELLVQTERQKEFLTSENELALLQISQLQEELEQTFLNNQTLSQKIEHKNAELKQLKDEYNQKMANSISIEQSIANDNEYQAKINALELKVCDLESENELALLQINQLQEELEFYYIKFQQGGLWTPISISSDVSAPHYLQNTLSLMTL
ncbi:hypothetical protein [Shewanella metallivivens]|uniref:Chromosome segregation ATPase n=1 Tax=Shewanella metallivivens TaxID=2872342 RepID=A0ABT5TL44_9GAMM|nr:hypothetical protein [Shewanella metallivivens]MDD8059338.1 hypothetical protein [Shewanella metallivivens]